MKNFTILITFLILLVSCEKDSVDNYEKENIKHKIALDTLRNYSDYIIADFGKELLVSTDVFVKGYSALIGDSNMEKSPIQFNIGYRLIENNEEKSAFVYFGFLEDRNKLDSSNYHKYKSFTDFVDFFDRNELTYKRKENQYSTTHTAWIIYKNRYTVNEDFDRYSTNEYDPEMKPENFQFFIDSIFVNENPIKNVEVYYSFKCIGVNSYNDELVMKNGKGKSTFEYK